MLKPTEAWSLLEAECEALPTERLSRTRAQGRVLSEAIEATLDVPPADLSAMDGFALAPDAEAAVEIPVTGTVAAGDAPGARLAPGAALRIMTGAVVPEGADRVVPVEDTESPGEGVVVVRELPEPGRHIRRMGEVSKTGETLLRPGKQVNAATLSLLATHGVDDVPVHRAPTVAHLTTGSELVTPERAPEPGQIRDSHSDYLRAALRDLGIQGRALGIVPDVPELLRDAVRGGLTSDVLILSGGVSMGEFDFVEDVLAELGCRLLFDAVAIQPGKPMVAARHERGWVFGLPGNPASAMVTFTLFVRPVLRRLMGYEDAYWRGALNGVLAAPLPGAKGRDRFLPARVEAAGEALLVEPVVPLGSHDVGGYAFGSALVRIPAGSQPAPPGDPCSVLPLVDWRCGA